jgi:hypothetical protein
MAFGTAFVATMPYKRRPGADVPTFSPKPKMHEGGFCRDFCPRWRQIAVCLREPACRRTAQWATKYSVEALRNQEMQMQA